jgi:hypothetical protein
MGLFNTIKKQKNINKKAEWKQGLIQTVVEFNEEYMQLITATVTDTIFYKDIMNVEVVVNVVNIKTNVKTFSLTAKRKHGGKDLANQLYNDVIVKMGENK